MSAAITSKFCQNLGVWFRLMHPCMSYTYFRKQLLVSVHYFIHLNLSISLCLGYLVFVTSVQPARESDVSATLTSICKVIKVVVFSKAACRIASYPGSFRKLLPDNITVIRFRILFSSPSSCGKAVTGRHC